MAEVCGLNLYSTGVRIGNLQMSVPSSEPLAMQHSMDALLQGYQSHMNGPAGMVQEVLHRRNAMTDPAIANIDQALMVFSLAQVSA